MTDKEAKCKDMSMYSSKKFKYHAGKLKKEIKKCQKDRRQEQEKSDQKLKETVDALTDENSQQLTKCNLEGKSMLEKCLKQSTDQQKAVKLDAKTRIRTIYDEMVSYNKKFAKLRKMYGKKTQQLEKFQTTKNCYQVKYLMPECKGECTIENIC